MPAFSRDFQGLDRLKVKQNLIALEKSALPPENFRIPDTPRVDSDHKVGNAGKQRMSVRGGLAPVFVGEFRTAVYMGVEHTGHVLAPGLRLHQDAEPLAWIKGVGRPGGARKTHRLPGMELVLGVA